jgi:hypothetical protein
MEAGVKTLAKCPVCGSGHFSLLYTAPTTRGVDRRLWSVFECKSCSHQFMNPQPSWEELEAYYNHDYDPYDPMHGSRLRIM